MTDILNTCANNPYSSQKINWKILPHSEKYTPMQGGGASPRVEMPEDAAEGCLLSLSVIGQFVFSVQYFMGQVGGYSVQYTSLFIQHNTGLVGTVSPTTLPFSCPPTLSINPGITRIEFGKTMFYCYTFMHIGIYDRRDLVISRTSCEYFNISSICF